MPCCCMRSMRALASQEWNMRQLHDMYMQLCLLPVSTSVRLCLSVSLNVPQWKKYLQNLQPGIWDICMIQTLRLCLLPVSTSDQLFTQMSTSLFYVEQCIWNLQSLWWHDSPTFTGVVECKWIICPQSLKLNDFLCVCLNYQVWMKCLPTRFYSSFIVLSF